MHLRKPSPSGSVHVNLWRISRQVAPSSSRPLKGPLRTIRRQSRSQQPWRESRTDTMRYALVLSPVCTRTINGRSAELRSGRERCERLSRRAIDWQRTHSAMGLSAKRAMMSWDVAAVAANLRRFRGLGRSSDGRLLPSLVSCISLFFGCTLVRMSCI